MFRNAMITAKQASTASWELITTAIKRYTTKI